MNELTIIKVALIVSILSIIGYLDYTFSRKAIIEEEKRKKKEGQPS